MTYTEQEQKVCDYLLHITDNKIGCGDDPISFLIASHSALIADNKKSKKALELLCTYLWNKHKGKERMQHWIEKAEQVIIDDSREQTA